MEVQCPSCKRIISLSDDYKGRQIKCDGCGNMFTAATIESVSLATGKNLVCNDCGEEIQTRGHILEDQRVACERCYRNRHRAKIDRGVVPPEDPHTIIRLITCPMCAHTLWIRASDMTRSRICSACGRSFVPEQEKRTRVLLPIEIALAIIVIFVIIQLIILVVRCLS